MKIDLNPGEIEILLSWSEEATKGKFNLGDDPAALTWEESNLIKKLKEVLQRQEKNEQQKKNG